MTLSLSSHVKNLILPYLLLSIKTGDAFPVAFARSLVAISNHKDDNSRNVSIQIRRKLSSL